MGNLILLEEVNADVSLVDLGATNDANLRVHDNVIWDGEGFKGLSKMENLLGVVLTEHFLLL